MPVLASCPSCQTKVKGADHLAGKVVKCPKCQGKVPLPPAQTSAAPPAVTEEKRLQGRLESPGMMVEYDLKIGGTAPSKQVAAPASSQKASSPAPGQQGQPPARKNKPARRSPLLDRDVWLMRRHENLLFQSYKKSLDFFAADGKEKIGRSQERPPLVTTLLKGFSLFRPWLKTYHTTLDQDGQSSHFTIEVAGDRWHRKVVVRDADEGFLWKKDFTKTGMITGFTLYTEDDNTLATLKKGTLASPSGEVWGRICGEDALELANDLKTGKMLRVKFMPKTPGLYLAIHPSVANRDDIKILLLSVAATLEAVNISYRV